MNYLAEVSSIMTKDLLTVAPTDGLERVKEIFDNHNIHHIPVVRYKKIVGMLSKYDYMGFLAGLRHADNQDVSLASVKVEQIMTTGLGKLEPSDRINIAIDIFNMNRFHALPVVEKEELVGLVTTHDLIKSLAHES
ncbi:MAG: CBS domain-containing protein [Bacteroidota bacterium]